MQIGVCMYTSRNEEDSAKADCLMGSLGCMEGIDLALIVRAALSLPLFWGERGVLTVEICCDGELRMFG